MAGNPHKKHKPHSGISIFQTRATNKNGFAVWGLPLSNTISVQAGPESRKSSLSPSASGTLPDASDALILEIIGHNYFPFANGLGFRAMLQVTDGYTNNAGT